MKIKVIKRNKDVVFFDKEKIVVAINKAMNDINCNRKDIAIKISNNIEQQLLENNNKEITVEFIENLVEDKLMASSLKDVARAYIRYRYKRELVRELNKRDNGIMDLISNNNEELKKENSNKDSRINNTIRDYIAGESCKDIAKRIMIPKHIVDAHNKGIIHFHDMDYSPLMPMNNCGLINLEDMLQNGTVIGNTMIETPKSFRSACTITTQIITAVASSQYGGNSFSLSHLAPFVDISRKKIKEQVLVELEESLELYSSEYKDASNKITEKRLLKEIKDGIQTIQYQLITMSTTNGQSPFTTMFMYLNEVEDEKTKNDLSMIIEEVLKQRIVGVKNEQGVYITTAFPKIIYVLEEDNIHENSKYFYLTKLAVECSSKRLVPDYISEKKMKELKEGNCFPVMGKVLPM